MRAACDVSGPKAAFTLFSLSYHSLGKEPLGWKGHSHTKVSKLTPVLSFQRVSAMPPRKLV